MSDKQPVHVAVGVLRNAAGEILISLRHPESHQGGLWEFPGGKVEKNESLLHALDREFQEELGIRVSKAYPLLKCNYDYADKSVLLDVWEIIEYEGAASGREGQEISWRTVASLDQLDFPAANLPIIRMLQLPRVIAITPELGSLPAFLACIENLLAQQVDAIQIRQKQLKGSEYTEWFRLAQALAEPSGVKLICNTDLSIALELDVAAIHLDSTQLMSASARPVSMEKMLSVSCHTLEELRQAENIQADMAFLSPVAATSKYRADQLLGWDGFRQLSSRINMPIVALGGLRRDQLSLARRQGAFGVAGIQMFTGSKQG